MAAKEKLEKEIEAHFKEMEELDVQIAEAEAGAAAGAAGAAR